MSDSVVLGVVQHGTVGSGWSSDCGRGRRWESVSLGHSNEAAPHSPPTVAIALRPTQV